MTKLEELQNGGSKSPRKVSRDKRTTNQYIPQRRYPLKSKNRLGSNGRLTVRLINKMREIAATAVPRAQPCNK